MCLAYPTPPTCRSVKVDWARYLEPRDRDEAKRTAAILTMLAAGVTLLFAVVSPPTGGFAVTLATFLVPLVLLAVSLVMLRVSARWQLALWAPFPIVGIVAIAGLDLATHDASAAAQVFLCYPVIYAASQLRPPAAIFACLCALVGDMTVVLAIEPFGPAAISDLCYVSATLLAMSVLLIRAGQRQEALVVELRRQVAIDPLTGLATRRVLDDALRSALTSNVHDGGTALAMLDIDRFKTVNDRYGHPVGDAVLVHIATILVENTRPDTIICRIGGDEIAFLLPGCTQPAAVQRAERLVRLIRESPLRLASSEMLRLSVSVGVAHAPHPHDDETKRELYAAADAALYNAKRAGRDRVGVPVGATRAQPPLSA
jgi:diguanylate cyclase (GGDEF)-like protein